MSRVFERFIDIRRERGLFDALCLYPPRWLLNRSRRILACAGARLLRAPRTFVFDGSAHRYRYHLYNDTWRNERSVELPIVWDLVRRHPPNQVLEVGNVLSHYHPIRHDVVDKYERADGVIQQDCVDFRPQKRYALIVSISTLEHVGWDPPEPREPQRVVRAIENLRGCLAPGGTFLFTAPVGYNPNLDRWLDETPSLNRRCLRRVSASNEWKEAAWEEVRETVYDSPYPCANALVVGILGPA